MFWLIKIPLYILGGIFGGGIILTSGFVSYLTFIQPPLYFPKPTGQYAVGMKTYHWIDTSRKETLANDPAHPNRELMVNIWYPIDGQMSKLPTTPYAPYVFDYYKKNQTLTWLLMGLSRPIYSYAQPAARIAVNESPFPVIIFSHGFGLSRDSNTANCEELASHGYVVVGISHTYDSSVVQFPDGRIADGFKSIGDRMPKFEKFSEMANCLSQAISTWTSDVHFVLDRLEELAGDKASVFYQRFDQKKIGIFGHSMGGATAVQICRNDERVKAAVDLDGDLLGSDATKKFNKPCMFMLSEDGVKVSEHQWTQEDWKRFKISSLDEEMKTKARGGLPTIKKLTQSIGHDTYTLVLKNAAHLDFCDTTLDKSSLVCRVLFALAGREAMNLGTIDGRRMTEVVNAYLVNFFDKYLKGQSSELLDGQDKRFATDVEAMQWKGDDENGKVTKLILHQGGGSMIAEKMTNKSES